MHVKDFLITAKETLIELTKPLITISSIVGFAFVLNYSGMAGSIGNALALSGVFFPFISPIIGWLGVFITGSDTCFKCTICQDPVQYSRVSGN